MRVFCAFLFALVSYFSLQFYSGSITIASLMKTALYDQCVIGVIGPAYLEKDFFNQLDTKQKSTYCGCVVDNMPVTKEDILFSRATFESPLENFYLDVKKTKQISKMCQTKI